MHTCHAIHCDRHISPKLLMCKQHWSMLPTELQDNTWRHYRKGQEVDKRPSEAYIRAQLAAINYVAAREGQAQCDIEKRIAFLKKHGHLEE